MINYNFMVFILNKKEINLFMTRSLNLGIHGDRRNKKNSLIVKGKFLSKNQRIPQAKNSKLKIKSLLSQTKKIKLQKMPKNL